MSYFLDSKRDKFLTRLNYLIDKWDLTKVDDFEFIKSVVDLCTDEIKYIDDLEFTLFKYKTLKGGLYEK